MKSSIKRLCWGSAIFVVSACQQIRPEVEAESRKRFAYVEELSRRENRFAEWLLSDRLGLRFEDGMSGITFIDASSIEGPWDSVRRESVITTGEALPKKAIPVRWMHRRSHFRIKAKEPMVFSAVGAINFAVINTRPRVELIVQGALASSALVGDDGNFCATAYYVPADEEWSDVYLTLSTVGSPERAPRDLRVARLLQVKWEPLND